MFTTATHRCAVTRLEEQRFEEERELGLLRLVEASLASLVRAMSVPERPWSASHEERPKDLFSHRRPLSDHTHR
jgi:hypothetical protein